MISAAGLIIDDSENVYVCEKGGDCIHVLSKSGDFIRRINFGRIQLAISLFETKWTSALFVAGDMSTILQTFILNGSFTFYWKRLQLIKSPILPLETLESTSTSNSTTHANWYRDYSLKTIYTVIVYRTVIVYCLFLWKYILLIRYVFTVTWIKILTY